MSIDANQVCRLIGVNWRAAPPRQKIDSQGKNRKETEREGETRTQENSEQTWGKITPSILIYETNPLSLVYNIFLLKQSVLGSFFGWRRVILAPCSRPRGQWSTGALFFLVCGGLGLGRRALSDF